ncbi:MAG: hypothetical protein J4F43_02315 [Dehalococcoidia bacterium]|nr:hypothetical protein [Dehalococcoidia bacterium]
MEIGSTRINAGTVEFALHHRNIDGGKVGASNPDQGVCIQVMAEVNGRETELLRFDCFDVVPHYHYGPQKKNERYNLDVTTAGNPIGWTIAQFRERLAQMIVRAGYKEVAETIDGPTVAGALEQVEVTAREMARTQRSTVIHNRGDEIIDAGVIRFGLEFRNLANDGGLAIHVLGDEAGQEVELLAFDCFVNAPHYHYGPRNKNHRIFWDTTLVPDTLRWTLDQFKAGKLPAMIQRAGYPGIVADLDQGLLNLKLEELERRAIAKEKANAEAAD